MYKNNIYIMLSMYIAIIKFDSKLCIFLPTYPMKFILKIINFKIEISINCESANQGKATQCQRKWIIEMF